MQNLSTLSVNNPIKGYQSIFTNKGDKLGEVFVSLRLLMPGSKYHRLSNLFDPYFSIVAHDSNENLAAMSGTSDISNPPSRRNSIDHFENGLRTYKLDRPYYADHLNSVHLSDSISNQPQQRFDSTVPFTPYTSDSKTTQSGER